MSKVSSQALVPASSGTSAIPADHPVFAQQHLIERLARMLHNLSDGEYLMPSKLDQVKAPTAGGAFWSVPSAQSEDGVVAVSAMQVIILHTENRRTYFAHAYGDGAEKSPPVCVSDDGVWGIGEIGDSRPGRLCRTCPKAQFYSAAAEGLTKPGNKSQACRAHLMLYVVPVDSRLDMSVLPVVVRVPPASIGTMSTFLVKEVENKLSLAPHEVVVKLGIKVMESGAIKYSTVVPSIVAPLNEQERQLMHAYQDTLLQFLPPPRRPVGNVTVTEEVPAEGYEVTDGPEIPF